MGNQTPILRSSSRQPIRYTNCVARFLYSRLYTNIRPVSNQMFYIHKVLDFYEGCSPRMNCMGN